MSSKNEAVFVNIVEVEPSRYEELVAIVKEGNETVIRKRPGFISAFLAVAPDQSRVVTVARWRNVEAIQALMGDPVVTDFAKRTATLARSNPQVFVIAEEFRP